MSGADPYGGHRAAVDVRTMRILIADDNDSNSELLRQLLIGAGYHHVSATRDAEDVPRLCTTDPRPDLLLLDLHMPGLSGYEIMGCLRDELSGPGHLPVLVVTADVTPEAKRRALSLGASDFVTKPVDAVEVLLRTANLLRATRLQRELNFLVEQRTSELERARRDMLDCLALAAEYRDDITRRHTQRVGRTAALIAAQLDLPLEQVELIKLAAPLHDVGKLGVPDAILLKPGPLTDEEMAMMREHVEIGAQILGPGSAPEIVLAREIALNHHERWDGRGYKRGLAGEAIPVAARITAVADMFDAVAHRRPYKSAVPLEEAVAMVVQQSGLQFDPAVVRAFLALDHVMLVDPVADGAALPRRLAA